MFGRRNRKGIGKRNDGERGRPVKECICPECRHVINHAPGEPCFKKKCPQCGTPMMGRLK